MQKEKITASTLEVLLRTVAEANRERPRQGSHLFKRIVERIESARAGAADEPAN